MYRRELEDAIEAERKDKGMWRERTLVLAALLRDATRVTKYLGLATRNLVSLVFSCPIFLLPFSCFGLLDIRPAVLATLGYSVYY
jgi:hypothetical protein